MVFVFDAVYNTLGRKTLLYTTFHELLVIESSVIAGLASSERRVSVDDDDVHYSLLPHIRRRISLRRGET